MKLTTSEYKEIAREALRGNWFKAVASMLLAACLGAFCTSAFFILLFFAGMGLSIRFFESLPYYFLWLLMGGIVLAVFYFFVGGAVRFGYINFNLALLDKRPARLRMVVGRFPQLWKAVYMKVRLFFYELAFSLFLIVPGIVAAHTYAMVPYILEEKQDFSVGKAMRMSKKIMKGHRWQLFKLRFHFLGWYLFGILTVGVGFLYVLPYAKLTEAVFYNEISGRADAYYGRNTK